MSQLQNKKILWVNPSFLDYRIPLYKEVNDKTGGNFHLLYSKSRIPQRCHDKIREAIGENAHWIDTESKINLGNSSSDFSNSSLSIPFPKGLYSKIAKVKPDAIISEGFFQFTPWSVLYSFLHRIPLYIAYERTAHTERNCPWWRKLYRKMIGLFVDGYLANGSLTKEYLISQGVRPEKVITGGMCADSKGVGEQASAITQDQKNAFVERLGLNKSTSIRWIFVGRMIKLKGIIYLLKAWREHIKKHPKDELLIVGDGPLLKSFRQDFEDEQSIHFVGGVDYSQIGNYYAISDIFIIPTLEDNWSLVVPEAMACRLPIACSIYNGCHPELVKTDFNGKTFDPLNQDSILECLEYFHYVDLNKFGYNSRELEKNYSPETTAENVLKLLHL